MVLLYVLRADRLTPFIPAPVFAGFSNSIAIALLMSQWRTLRHLAADAPLPACVLSIALVALACAFAVRRVVGELGFLDRSPRSATVIAQTDVLVASLGREHFERLSHDADAAVPKLLANLASALAQRLRHTSRLAIARHRTR